MLQVPKEWMKYILAKGFIAVDGCSLTVSPCPFSCSVIASGCSKFPVAHVNCWGFCIRFLRPSATMHSSLTMLNILVISTTHTSCCHCVSHIQVGEVGGDWFSIYLIPETLRVTVLGTKQQGDTVNLEIEAQTQVSCCAAFDLSVR